MLPKATKSRSTLVVKPTIRVLASWTWRRYKIITLKSEALDKFIAYAAFVFHLSMSQAFALLSHDNSRLIILPFIRLGVNNAAEGNSKSRFNSEFIPWLPSAYWAANIHDFRTIIQTCNRYLLYFLPTCRNLRLSYGFNILWYARHHTVFKLKIKISFQVSPSRQLVVIVWWVSPTVHGKLYFDLSEALVKK